MLRHSSDCALMGNGQLALLAAISCWPKSPSVSHQVARDVQWMCLTLVERMLGYSIYMSTCIECLESVACPLEDHFTTFNRSSNSYEYHIDFVILFYSTIHSIEELKYFELGFHIVIVTLPFSHVGPLSIDQIPSAIVRPRPSFFFHWSV